ncbi:hypothetical protein GCM10010103_18910 [Streptomyces paradoxus]|uniref:DNA-binding LacI/PurR family transcriptional regulator n=1 Tax=Streptomyces paradoxus TaxID=66375 RepID=A0A7W9WFU1_9ACTN|nr:substrate-binding domain-containing protein [Streptomyces paradoxus]MBB6075996.1 DNA-binding LacI/PurR family transcriptional regulator [Streptomyces paradoxus]
MVKITDVARRAGGSPSTVSYALSGKRPISDATRRRVEEAARELGFRARTGTPAGRPNVLALAAPLRPGVHVPVVMRLAVSVVTTAARHGPTTSVQPGDPDPAAAQRLAERLLREHPALTAVVIHNEPLPAPLIAAFEHLGRHVPAVLSVTALCPDDLAQTPSVPVTSVSLPPDEPGTRAVELLFQKRHGVPVPETTLLPPRLTERSSTRHA